jgi:hypothetical protein
VGHFWQKAEVSSQQPPRASMTEHHKPLFRDADLSKRYGRTSRTINEWKRKKILPPADMTIQDRDYWYPETIEANERKRFSAKQSGDAKQLTT